jgi:hypothetical protein
VANHAARTARLAAKQEAAMLRNRLKREAIAQRVKASQESLQAAVRRISKPRPRL